MNIYNENEVYEETLKYFNDELPTSVIMDKYYLKNDENEFLEKSPIDLHRRLAKEFARIEKSKYKKPLSEDEIFNCFDNFKYIVPQGSPMFGIGNNHQTVSLSNCFTCDVPEDSYGDIMRIDEQIVQISKRRGGVGVCLDNLRPTGVVTHNAAKESTGIIPFMERYSNTIREVGQNNRRGALILILSVKHPQILDFIQAKTNKTKVTGANISVKLTNDFMEAVKHDDDFELCWPIDYKEKNIEPKVKKVIKAKVVWDEIVKNAHEHAEPGILFWDLVEKETPSNVYPEYKATGVNPCCFAKDGNYQVITKDGLKEIKNITKDDLIYIQETDEFVKTSGYFDAGKATVYAVTFSNGEIIEITDNHKLCKVLQQRTKNTIIYKEGPLLELKKLKIGDKIAAHTNKVNNINYSKIGTYEEGVILGWLSGDGCLSFVSQDDNYPTMILDFWQQEYDLADKILDIFHKMRYDLKMQHHTNDKVKSIRTHKYVEELINKYQLNIWKFKSENKELPFIYNCSKEFLKGYISAYFTADGTVGSCDINSNYNIQFSSINKARMIQIKNILNLFGIKSSISLGRKAGESEFTNCGKYQTKDCWRLTITGQNNFNNFNNEFGFLSSAKQTKLNDICTKKYKKNTKCSNYTTIKNIELIGEKEIGCIEVEKYHKFTVNGIISGNSELILGSLDSCRLMLLNLYSFVDNPFTKDASFDFKKFGEYTRICQRLMDDMVDLESEKIKKIIDKISNDPESTYIKQRELDIWNKILKICIEGRRTGTGTTGLGDAIAALGMKYGDPRCLNFIDVVYRGLKLNAYRESVELAKEIGTFVGWSSKNDKKSSFIQRIESEDPKLFNDMMKYGRRNVALLTNSPAGSVSILTQTTSGVEPLFMMSYTRRRKLSDNNIKEDFIDANGDRWKEYVVYHPKIKTWMEVTGETDINKSPWFGSCAEDIDWKNRVQLQGIMQKHICHSISSTINLQNDVNIDVVKSIYQTSWENGCKGITIYRKGSRDGVLIDNNTKKEENINTNNAPKRPKELPCDIYHIKISKKLDKLRVFDYMVMVGLYNDNPYEVFAVENGKYDKKVTKGKIIKETKGRYHLIMSDNTEIKDITKDTTESEDALTRMTSTSLRHGVNVTFIVDQLSKVSGELLGFSKSLARALKYYIKNGAKSGETCECGSKFIFENGCYICKNCGSSKCA